MASHSLIVPFLDDSLSFACGVEIGMLYILLRDTEEDEIEDLYLSQNDEQIALMASRMGWRVAKLKHPQEGWVWMRLERRAT